MTKFCYLLLLSIILTPQYSFSQRKILNAIPSGNIIIDGKFNEPIWKDAPIAKNFVMFSPDNGKPINEDKKTEAQIAYNDDGIYIAAKMYDNEPTKILKEITQRDNFGISENFGVFLNGLNDGQQDFRFFVSAAGVQSDCIFTNENGEDFTWDAIWESKVNLTDFGWVVEIKIPYAALRFSNEKKQTWGLNFYREIRRDRQLYTWNFIDSKINNESAQSGILQGIENIKPPTRLFFIPFSSYYLRTGKAEKPNGEIKSGLDIKYGINDAFTLDAILVPDFGQTKFDNIELNLGPFEQQFTENRPFFTEGTDLFKKGNLLYSRRIGQSPELLTESNESIENYPTTIKLINALKISGRTKNGLGIGILNAVTEKTNVSIKNNSTNETQSRILQPLTNYNVLVLDQRFKKNSSISFVNTNVTRNGHFRDANVSAALFDLSTNENTYNLKGDFKYSYINEFEKLNNKQGFNTSLNLAETIGNYRFGIGGKYVSKDYDNNDLGINFQTQYHSINGKFSYRILNPIKNYNLFQTTLDFNSEFNNTTGRIQEGTANLTFDTTNKKNDYYGYGISTRPVKTYDFYEPRSNDNSKFLRIPENIETWFFFSSNFNRKFSIGLNPYFSVMNEKNRVNYGFTASPGYRFDDHFSLNYKFSIYKQNNNIGWIAFDENDNAVLARRNIITYTNTLQGKYSINNKMNLNLSLRHYWSYVINHNMLSLNADGSVSPNFIFTENKNKNYNLWNLDLSYTWWFAPGSQIAALYRNSSALFENEFNRTLGKNFNNAIKNENLDHIFSISIRYFIDYNSLKNNRFR